MNMYEIDFIIGGHWFTYDVYENDIFSAACSIMRIEKNIARITNITFIKADIMKQSDIKRALDLHGVKSVMFAYDLYAVDAYTIGFKLVKTTGWDTSDLRNFLNY